MAFPRKWGLWLCRDRNRLPGELGCVGLEGLWGSSLSPSAKTIVGSGPAPCFRGAGAFLWPS